MALRISALIALLLAAGAVSLLDSRLVWERTHNEFLTTALPHDATICYEIGNYYFGNPAYDLKKAEKYFNCSLELDGDFFGSHYQLARIAFVKNDMVDALRHINQELTLHPDHIRAYYVRGLVYGYGGILNKAEEDFQTFIEWKPSSWAGRNDLAWIYFQMGEFDKALIQIEAALQFDPDNAWLLNSKGVALMNLGEVERARDTLERALAAARRMTAASWGRAYPGNDPVLYEDGIRHMTMTIQNNIALLARP